jgi:hypothetical protein
MDDIKSQIKTDIKIGSLFSIPFCKIQVEDFVNKKKDLINLFARFDEKKNDEELANFSSNRYNTKLVNEEFTNILRYELQSIVNAFKTDFYVSDVWSVTYKENGYHPIHNHGSVGLSCILYLTLPTDAPKTSFLQPWNNFLTDKSTYAVLDVKEGDILVVPSFVNHFTQQNKSKSEKRIISWDMKDGSSINK